MLNTGLALPAPLLLPIARGSPHAFGGQAPAPASQPWHRRAGGLLDLLASPAGRQDRGGVTATLSSSRYACSKKLWTSKKVVNFWKRSVLAALATQRATLQCCKDSRCSTARLLCKRSTQLSDSFTGLVCTFSFPPASEHHKLSLGQSAAHQSTCWWSRTWTWCSWCLVPQEGGTPLFPAKQLQLTVCEAGLRDGIPSL